MRSGKDNLLRQLVDGLIARAEVKPRGYESARLLREAAASLLDADVAEQREVEANQRRAA